MLDQLAPEPMPGRGLWVVLLVTASVIGPTSALGSAEGSRLGAGWVLFDFVHHERTNLEVFMSGLTGGGTVGVVAMFPNGTVIAGISLSRVDSNPLVSVDIGDHPPTEMRFLTSSTGGGSNGPELTLLGGAFTGYLLVWSAGEMASTSWRFDQEGTNGSISYRGQGDRWFYSEGEGFDSDCHVAIETARLSLTVQQGGRMPIALQGHFFGYVGLGTSILAAGDQSIWIELADGERRDCRCQVDLGGPSAIGPGTMVIHRDATLVETSFPTMIITGVDVAWPPP